MHGFETKHCARSQTAPTVGNRIGSSAHVSWNPASKSAMFRYLCVLVLVLAAVDAEAQVDKSFAELFDTPKASASIKSSVKRQQNNANDACEKDLKQLKSRLTTAHRDLKQLNNGSSVGSNLLESRTDLHEQIGTLEQSVRSQVRECDHDIPSRFDIELAKASLADKWPDRRERIKLKADQGLGRDRKHGDVEDIGYRNVGGGLEGQLKDVSTGEQAVRQMKASGRMPSESQDANLQRYVESLARRIATSSDLRIPLKVTVMESNDIDAMGLPGGFLYVTTGLLHACESEDQLAGVLAREIAHIAARHGAQNSKRSLLAKFLVPAARVAAGVFTGSAVSAGTYYGLNYGFQGLQSIVDRTLLGTGEGAQKEADQLGIQYAWNAGYDPKGFIEFLDALAKQHEYFRSESWFKLKPSLDSRLMGAYTEIQYLPAREINSSNSADFRSALKR